MHDFNPINLILAGTLRFYCLLAQIIERQRCAATSPDTVLYQIVRDRHAHSHISKEQFTLFHKQNVKVKFCAFRTL